MDLIGRGYSSALAITIFTILIYCFVLGRSARSTAKPEGKSTSAPGQTNTFRASGVPADWDRQKLQSFLKDQEGITDAVIESFAYENNGSSQVATVTFGNAPSRLQRGHGWPILISEEFNTKSNRKQYLTVDKDFYGMTALYTLLSQDHKIDVIALSGLGGHAFGSFKERGGSYMWLRDSLLHDLTSETNGAPMA
ncbi:hypothetical protein M441DRAFT_71921 [Trichoderma asperellum CBS 433.97]|uniref:Uncharacterized protein n=1 Tax=Trichoderma asperellum (strain ATCC 204424 / CBS 433.97 / NBRC 101777) TaxID=1042311 RepID=A0A2T3Z104_TRIA4|nr:hypothetical protein M441DRAFT_71921 [Trichoderma asperellum CBS 433.97]PTB38488.1 hypothetical protein M441DRAFT_71921 [Trichoderma asperellum CBS 433.97]